MAVPHFGDYVLGHVSADPGSAWAGIWLLDSFVEPNGREEGLKSLTKVMRILDSFSTLNRTLSLADICRLTGFPKSTTHRLLLAMRDAGLLDQHGERDRYRLGIKLFELGNTVLANMELLREARPFVDALARQGGEAVHLAVFDGYRAVVIERADAVSERETLRPTVEQAPIHCTAVGKAILAFQSEAAIERIIELGLERFTENTITDPRALRRELEKVRDQGYALDEAEHQPGLRCIGAPIWDQSGRVIAAVSLTGPTWRLPLEEVGTRAKVVVHQAMSISRSLGYRIPGPAVLVPDRPRR